MDNFKNISLLTKERRGIPMKKIDDRSILQRGRRGRNLDEMNNFKNIYLLTRWRTIDSIHFIAAYSTRWSFLKRRRREGEIKKALGELRKGRRTLETFTRSILLPFFAGFNLTILDYRCRGWSQGGSSSSSWNSRAQSGRDSATKDKERGREREKETLGNRDEARVFSLLSRAELITRRTANRAKRQSGYILSRIRDAFAYAH